MVFNESRIIERYNLRKEDERPTLSRSSSLEFYYTKKHLQSFIKKTTEYWKSGARQGVDFYFLLLAGKRFYPAVSVYFHKSNKRL